MSLLQLDQLSQKAVDSLKPSFKNLPQTNHKDGKYRLRRYSVIELRTSFWNAKEEAEIRSLDHREFVQSEDLNKHQGGMGRHFQEIESSTLQSAGMKESTLLFKKINKFVDGQEIEIHQMRIISRAYNIDPVKVAPEGIHQDGFDKIAIISINRTNISGGQANVYRQKHDSGRPIVSSFLQDGEMLTINDKELWHWASDIRVVDPTKDGYFDAFVFCANTT